MFRENNSHSVPTAEAVQAISAAAEKQEIQSPEKRHSGVIGKMQYSLVFCCGSSQTAAFSQTQIPEKRKPIPVSRKKCLLTLF